MIDSARLFRAPAPLQATSVNRSGSDPSPESSPDLIDDLAQPADASGVPILSSLESDGNQPKPESPATPNGDAAQGVVELADFQHRQRQLVLATLVISALALPISALVWDLATAGSVLVGSLAGLLYLRLLGRSVQRLGTASKQMGRGQLLVPVVLVLAAAKLPQLQLLPALLGFLLYKPALFLQARPDA